MAYEDIKLLIDGEWRKGDGGGEDIINPATGEVIGHCPHASAAELDMALAAAEKGFAVWSKKTPLERSQRGFGTRGASPPEHPRSYSSMAARPSAHNRRRLHRHRRQGPVGQFRKIMRV